MAEGPFNLLPSVLDRLIDDDPESPQDPRQSRNQQLQALRNAVRRDLEALLNSHARCISPPPELAELNRSVIEYGLKDYLSAYAGGLDVREQFRAAVQDAIRRFEPRFIKVSVKLRDDAEQLDRTLRFRIDAVVYAEPSPEPVVFDSTLDPSSHTFQITGVSDA